MCIFIFIYLYFYLKIEKLNCSCWCGFKGLILYTVFIMFPCQKGFMFANIWGNNIVHEVLSLLLQFCLKPVGTKLFCGWT